MLTINTKIKVEKDFKKIIQNKYNGDVTKALIGFIEYERMKDLSWKEKFQFQLNQLRQKVNSIGGIGDQQIEAAIKNYRKKIRTSEK
ncbi:MAG: hypothetical protein ACMUIP_06940 [bacterium]